MMEEGNQGSAGNGMSFTQAQRSAIEVTGNVLVAAAAGAGKTRTLVERCARLIVQGADVQDFLLVTFTEAAGAEMRSRLRAELEKLARTSGDERLHGQVALLDTAAIGTLHSFCLRLIREHFHALELDPQLVILDEQQTGPLVEAALDRAIDPLLRESSSLGKALRSWLNNLPGDAMVRMRTRVKRIHVYSRSLPFHARWLSSEAGRFARHEADGWVKQVFAELSRWAAVQGARLSAASGVPALSACAEALSSLAEGPGTAGGWAVALAAIHDADKSLWPKGEKTRLRAPFKGFFDAAAFLKGIFGEDGKTFLNGIRQDWERARNEMLLLLEITDRFGKQFDLAKRELGGVDFSDQEQLCLRLLI
ncbi:MAG: hypothetical protein FJ405_18740, partial [Verrucomicrobia bacterium]|nr:hypothetical protein [Verrucomicrobiota bacterium]